MLYNLHTHTAFCDGRDTAEDMVRAAIARNFVTLGFSSHSDMLDDFGAYVAEIRRLAAAYGDRICVLCGIEAELAKPYQRAPELDYVIGSVHAITGSDGVMFAIDHTPEILQAGIRAHFDGDAVAYVKAYFAAVRAPLGLDFDIVGHPDLVRKYNERQPYFDEHAAWYLGELEATADAIAASGKYVEVNTGAIARGWQSEAYPAPAFRDLLRARGVRFVLSSDAHATEALDCAFDRYAASEAFVRPFGKM